MIKHTFFNFSFIDFIQPKSCNARVKKQKRKSVDDFDDKFDDIGDTNLMSFN